jgi:hypothetical protein
MESGILEDVSPLVLASVLAWLMGVALTVWVLWLQRPRWTVEKQQAVEAVARSAQVSRPASELEIAACELVVAGLTAPVCSQRPGRGARRRSAAAA